MITILYTGTTVSSFRTIICTSYVHRSSTIHLFTDQIPLHVPKNSTCTSHSSLGYMFKGYILCIVYEF